MGTGFSLDPNEYRSAADVIEGYGSIQADHGSTLAAGTSTPLSSSGSGIAGAISMIAQGTVQKIVTDVTSTTQGFANDTAAGLRAHANGFEQLETNIAGNANSILADTSSILPGGVFGVGGVGGVTVGGSGGSLGSGGAATIFGGGAALVTDAPTTQGIPGEGSCGASELGVIGAEDSGLTESGAAAGAGAEGAIGEARQNPAMQLGELRGAGRTGGGAAGEERGRRPTYLKSRAEVAAKNDDPMKAAARAHLQTCGVAPVPFAENRLVCAKCGTILEVGDAQSLSA